MNVYDEVLYPKLRDIDARTTWIMEELEALVSSPDEDEAQKQKKGVELHARMSRVKEEFKNIVRDSNGVNLGPTTASLRDACRHRIMAVLARMLETVFAIKDEVIAIGDVELGDVIMIQAGDLVLVHTKTNNIYKGRFVSRSAQNITITVDKAERYIPAENVEYVDKLPTIEEQLGG